MDLVYFVNNYLGYIIKGFVLVTAVYYLIKIKRRKHRFEKMMKEAGEK